MNNNSIFKTFFLSLCIVANTSFAYTQTASILPQGKTQFLDANGKPLTSGTIDFYIPSTTTRKTTWQNSGETITNTNPVVLDAGGRAIIYGDGSYRQVVKDRNGNLIWDQLTTSAGSGSSSPTATGDGDLVGTIKPWAGMTAPNQYLFTYGQEVSRTTYATLFTAITSSQATFCTSGSAVISGLSDTTNFWIGMTVELSCIVAGSSTIVSKTSTTVTLAANSNVTTNSTAVFFPWGHGNGTTTFNLPDFRGFAIAGNNNMGGVASINLTTAYFGAATPNATGSGGGSQTAGLLISNLPAYTPTGTITNGAITNTVSGGTNGAIANTTAVSAAGHAFADVGGSIAVASAQAASTFVGVAQGGTSVPFSIIQPTKTSNYIIKVTPDTNSSTASGVTSLGSMTGDIACGSGLSCTGNIISNSTSAFFPFFPPTLFSSGIANGHFVPWLDEAVQYTSAGITPFGVFSTNSTIIGAANSTIGSSTVGQTFSIRFTSTGLAGSPITATYIAVGGDTTATIATGLCNAINSNTTLNTLVAGSNGVFVQSQQPIFCYSSNSSATFNIQWSAALAPTGTTPLTLASIGTGTINIPATVNTIDQAVIQIARVPTGRTARDGDSQACFDFTGNSTAGFDTHYSQICVIASAVTSGAQQGTTLFSSASGGLTAKPSFSYGRGIALYDNSNIIASGGDQGFGTINLPTAYYLAGATLASSTGIVTPGNNIFGGTLNNSALNLQSTSSGSPSGDFVQIKAGGKVGYKFDGINSIFGTGGSLVGDACFSNLTSGTICIVPSVGALGTSVLTLPIATDTLVGKATTDELTNKTLTASVGKGTWTTSGTWTLPAFTLGGTVSGSGNQINNVVIGTTTPLAGSFTTLAASTSVTSPIFKATSSTVQLTSGAFIGVNVNNSGNIGLNTASPATQFHAHAAADQNFLFAGPTGGVITTGITIEALNDALGAFLPMHYGASLHYFDQGGISVGTTTDPGAGAILANTSIKATTTVTAVTGYNINTKLSWSATAPTTSSGFCTSPSISTNNGTAAFTITIGSACAASTGVLTMPSASSGWACHFNNVTTPASNTPYQTASTTTSVSVTNYSRTTGLASNWTASEIITAECTAY